jgi:hypothetical protein
VAGNLMHHALESIAAVVAGGKECKHNEGESSAALASVLDF